MKYSDFRIQYNATIIFVSVTNPYYKLAKSPVTGMDVLETSQVSRFYDGKNIFLTGGTGFLGKCFIEKVGTTTSCLSFNQSSMGKIFSKNWIKV